MKIILYGHNGRFNTTEEKISESEDVAIKTI